MRELDLFRVFTDPLNAAGIPYLVTGSVASMIYGEPRLTHDVDIVIELDTGSAKKIAAIFPEEEFYVPPDDVIQRESRRPTRGHFNLIHHASGYKGDFYTLGRDPLHAWAMERRLPIRFDDGGELWVAPPEYVILRKLEYFREGKSEKHLRDIQAMLEASETRIDVTAVEERVKVLGLEREWAAARKRIV